MRGGLACGDGNRVGSFLSGNTKHIGSSESITANNNKGTSGESDRAAARDRKIEKEGKGRGE